jgi:hypothetical protein
MIANLNIRTLGNKAIYVRYDEDGKSKDAGFINWVAFILWLESLEVDDDGHLCNVIKTRNKE